MGQSSRRWKQWWCFERRLHQNHKPRDWCSEWWARLWYKNQDSREISGSILKNFYASKDHENFAGSLVIWWQSYLMRQGCAFTISCQLEESWGKPRCRSSDAGRPSELRAAGRPLLRRCGGPPSHPTPPHKLWCSFRTFAIHIGFAGIQNMQQFEELLCFQWAAYHLKCPNCNMHHKIPCCRW